MTSLAFILGVLPLVFATGAGQVARHSVGTAVAGGMLVSTFLNIIFIPILYVVVQTMRGAERRGEADGEGPGGRTGVISGVILDTSSTYVVRYPVFFLKRQGHKQERAGGEAMQIEERIVDGVTILDLKGKMTLGEGDELLKDKINSLIQQDRKKLLLNLEGVPYIDSAGLGEIVRTYTTVSRQGGKLKLLNLTKRIQDLLAITKLLTVFETYEAEGEAIKSFS